MYENDDLSKEKVVGWLDLSEEERNELREQFDIKKSVELINAEEELGLLKQQCIERLDAEKKIWASLMWMMKHCKIILQQGKRTVNPV